LIWDGGIMTEQDMRRRTKQFAIRAIKLAGALPNSAVGRTIGTQLIRSATSVGANYWAACRGKSKADFSAKLAIVEEEADESAYWLELVMETGLLKQSLVEPLYREASEVVAIMVASRRTMGLNQKSKIKNQK
jgi:four helix bundle protein